MFVHNMKIVLIGVFLFAALLLVECQDPPKCSEIDISTNVTACCTAESACSLCLNSTKKECWTTEQATKANCTDLCTATQPTAPAPTETTVTEATGNLSTAGSTVPSPIETTTMTGPTTATTSPTTTAESITTGQTTASAIPTTAASNGSTAATTGPTSTATEPAATSESAPTCPGGQHFDGASFIGGIILTLAIMIILFVGCYCYRKKNRAAGGEPYTRFT